MKRLLSVALALGLLVGCNKTEELADKAEKETIELQENIENEKEKELADAEVAYIEVLENSINVFQDNVGKLRENFIKVEKDRYLWIDGNWRMEQKSYFDKINLELTNLEELENQNAIPEGYEEIHTALLNAFKKNVEAGEIMFGGEFTLQGALDGEKLQRGATLYGESLTDIATANQMLDEKQIKK